MGCRGPPCQSIDFVHRSLWTSASANRPLGHWPSNRGAKISAANRGPLPILGVWSAAGAVWRASRCPPCPFRAPGRAFAPLARASARARIEIFSRRGRGVRAEWQKRRKTLARLQRTTATMRGSRWQCRIGGSAGLRRAQAFLRHLAAFVLDGGAVVLLRIERRDLGIVLLLALADLAGRRRRRSAARRCGSAAGSRASSASRRGGRRRRSRHRS